MKKHFYLVHSSDDRFKCEIIAISKHAAIKEFRHRYNWIFQSLKIKPKLSAERSW